MRRQEIAGGARCEPTTAAVGVGGDRLLDVAHHHGDPGGAHQIDRGLRVGAVGHDIAGANRALGRNAEALSLGEHSSGGFEIAVWPAEDQHRTIEAAEVTDAAHD